MRIELFIGTLAAVLLFSASDILAAAWGKTNQWWWLLLLIIVGNAAWILFAVLNRHLPLATVGAIVNLGLVTMSTLASLILFREQLSTLERIALAIGFLSLFLFSIAQFSPADSKPEQTADNAGAMLQTSAAESIDTPKPDIGTP